MTQTIESRLKLLHDIEPIGKNEEKIRSLISEISALASCDEQDGGEKILSSCLTSLRALENNKCISTGKCEYSFFDLAKLLENVSLCSDILLADTGVNLRYEGENAEISCCPQIIIDAFLNLISNSVKFGSGNVVDVSVAMKNGNFSVLVTNEGKLDFSSCNPGIGIKTAANAARLHHGRLFYSSSNRKVRAGFSIPCGLEPTVKFDVPPFSYYLEDVFSPVRIGLAELF